MSMSALPSQRAEQYRRMLFGMRAINQAKRLPTSESCSCGARLVPTIDWKNGQATLKCPRCEPQSIHPNRDIQT